MQKRKKQLLGLAGLGLVVAMTFVASAIPAPEASAAEEYRGSVGLQVKVSNGEETSSVDILEPLDQDTVVHNNFTARISYTNLTDMKVYLQRKGSADKIQLPNNCTITESADAQVCEIPVNLDAELTPQMREAEYVLSVEGNGKTAVADSVSFTYKAAHLVFDEKYNGAGDPTVTVLANEKVKYAQVQVYDKDNKPMFVDKDGKETPVLVEIPDTYTDGEYVLDLPFKQYGLPDGVYSAVLTAYETETPTEGGLIAISTVTGIAYPKGYKPGGNPGGPGTTDPDDPNKPGDGDGDDQNKPGVPGTGNNLFKDLNISRADYIITGLVAFGMITAFAVFLIVRRNRR